MLCCIVLCCSVVCHHRTFGSCQDLLSTSLDHIGYVIEGIVLYRIVLYCVVVWCDITVPFVAARISSVRALITCYRVCYRR